MSEGIHQGNRIKNAVKSLCYSIHIKDISDDIKGVKALSDTDVKKRGFIPQAFPEFPNKSGVSLGALEPYFSMEDNEATEQKNYWEGWEKNITNFHIIDVDSPNHMMLLHEPESAEKIMRFCERLYLNSTIE